MDRTLLIPEEEQEEFDDMGSHNHSMVQANLAYLFKLDGSYSVFNELSLDVSLLDTERYNVKDEAIPDVCIYPKRSLSLPHDILRMTDMPLLVVEVLSPRQGTSSILEKFDAYFALGIQSCWLVDPLTQIVHVYRSPTERIAFSEGNVVDALVGIEMPLDAIFEV
ncbi:Uma2 family endonuclease [Chloroflexi bacterium TSY]|nr:Uma2 family endonuclease [Chloroflexi bacterium TSY]